MTLIEVVGGLGLLATLLVAILLAKARFTHQATLADRRLRAVAAADALLTEWHANSSSLRRSGSGNVPGDEALTWQTQVISNAALNQMGADVVRLEILDHRADAAENRVLSSVEFVVEPPQHNNGNVPVIKPPTSGHHRTNLSPQLQK